MAASLGLTLYNLRPRKDAGGLTLPRPPRPDGRLVWLHVPAGQDSAAVMTLARRLANDEGIVPLVTCNDALPAQPGVLTDQAPTDAPIEVRAFLDHWRPLLVILTDGELRPAAMHEATERGLPVMLVGGHLPHILRERDGWYPGLMRSVLGRVTAVHARDEEAGRAFRKAGALPSRVAVTGALEAEMAIPPVNEAERAGYARIVATRPIWAALGLPEAEEATVIATHRAALRYSHRLLLICEPADPLRIPVLAQLFAEEGWQVADRGQDEEPDIDCAVWLGRGQPDDEGLWLRLAPVTYLAGTLAGQGPLRDARGAAALGSALLIGPVGGGQASFLDRMARAQALRRVERAADLPDALTDLLSPDRAARLAQAAWAVTTEGSETTATVLRAIRQLLGPPGP